MTAALAPVTTQSTITLDGVQLLMRVTGGPQPVDGDGCEWTCTRLEGWTGRPKPRTTRTAKPLGMGAFRSKSFPDVRVIVMDFRVFAPSPDVIRSVEERLDAWCSDGGRLYPMVVRDPPLVTKMALVELDDSVLIKPVLTYAIEVSAQFAAPDPRKFANEWIDRTTGLPAPSIDGVEYTDGVDFVNGVDYGVGASPAIAQIANYGTAPVGPYLSVTGPAPQPVVTDLVSGWSMRYTDDLRAGDTLTVNCDEFPQRDQPGHSALLNGVTNVWSKVVRSGDWPTVDPQDIATYQITASALTSAVLVASLRSAWY